MAENLLFQRCQRSFWQSSYHSMSNCSSSKNNFDFFFFSQSAAKQKPPLLSLICLGRVPLGGGSTWTERALPEDYRMRGGEMSECVFMCMRVCWRCVYLCVMGMGVWWLWGVWMGKGGGGVKQFYPKCCNCPQDWTEQSSNAHFPVYSLSPLYLLIFVSQGKKISVKRGSFMWRGFLTELYALTWLS